MCYTYLCPLRRTQKKESALTIHRTRTRYTDETGTATYHWSTHCHAYCDCGWQGKVRSSESAVTLDKHRHLVDVGERKKPVRRSTRPRDGRKSKVYAAERCAFPQLNTNEFRNIEEVREEFARWTRTAWFKARYKGTPIELRSGNGSSYARWNEIKLWGGGHLNRWVLAHELAHVLVSTRDRASHDKHFCGAYIAIVQQFIGKEDADKLRAEFVASKIPHRVALKTVAQQKAA